MTYQGLGFRHFPPASEESEENKANVRIMKFSKKYFLILLNKYNP